MFRLLALLLVLFLFVLAVFAQDTNTEEQAPATLTLSLSMYLIVNDIDNPDPELSTARTEEDLRDIHIKMNDIWSQATIELDLQYVGYLVVPEAILTDIFDRKFSSFFQAVGEGDILIDNASQLNGFYIKDIGGPNGIMLSNQVYFVNDNPTVNDERVSSHEVGHMLGLHHQLYDPDQLMYSGTNGTNLNEVEITVARYFATGYITRVRR